MMQARVIEIYAEYSQYIKAIVPLKIEDEYMKIIVYLTDDTNLRVTEEWDGGELVHYSYYWLTSDNRLKIGWDNSLHHKQLENFPHHKHVGRQKNRHPSFETCLEDVMKVILTNLST
jgi:hypothetical protein